MSLSYIRYSKEDSDYGEERTRVKGAGDEAREVTEADSIGPYSD